MTPAVAVAITLVWTAVCGIALGFCLRGYAVARRRVGQVEPLDGLAVMQARRNLRVETVRVWCQIFGLTVGFLALGARAGVAASWVVQLGSTVCLMGIALLLLLDSILDDRHRGAIEAEEARAVAAALSPRHGGTRAYDPPVQPPPSAPPASSVPAEQNPEMHQP